MFTPQDVARLTRILKQMGFNKATWRTEGVSTKDEGFMVFADSVYDTARICYYNAGTGADWSEDEYERAEKFLDLAIRALEENDYKVRKYNNFGGSDPADLIVSR